LVLKNLYDFEAYIPDPEMSTTIFLFTMVDDKIFLVIGDQNGYDSRSPIRSPASRSPILQRRRMMHFPESPRSTSSFHSASPPKLDPNTLALLDAFFNEKADEERRFNEIASERAAAQIAGLALDDGKEEKPMVSVADFRLAFGEDWQLSQFW